MRTIFRTLDIKSAYNQIETKQPLTTFVSHIRLFEYKRLMLGINCPAALLHSEMKLIAQRRIQYKFCFRSQIA